MYCQQLSISVVDLTAAEKMLHRSNPQGFLQVLSEYAGNFYYCRGCSILQTKEVIAKSLSLVQESSDWGCFF